MTDTNWYTTVFKGWQVKALGPKPTAELFTQAHALGCRPGKQALAMAMYLRDGGATDGQVKMACIIQWGSSGSHHNKRRDLIAAKLVAEKPAVSDAQGHKVYAIALTARGTSKVEGAAATQVAVKATSKPRTGATGGKKPEREVTVTPAQVDAAIQADTQPVDQPQA